MICLIIRSGQFESALLWDLLTRYKDVKYSIDTHTRKILIAHFTDKTVDISYTKIMNAVLNVIDWKYRM